MTPSPRIRCAIYTRKSSEEGLEQSFNSLHAQREACEAYILSQRHEGWQLVPTLYDDGGFSGGTMERPALKTLLADIAAKRVDTVVVYKVDRLTRSLSDFARIVEQFDKQGISFVSVTQQFNTTTSMGRLTLNVLLSFAQFEREVTGERIRDKIAASKKKGMWMGGMIPFGYDIQDRNLVINPGDAEKVLEMYRLYIKLGSVSQLKAYLQHNKIFSKIRVSRAGRTSGGAVYSRGALYELLQNRIYLGEITHKGDSYPGRHPAIIDPQLWEQVQSQLQANLQAPRTRPRSTEQSLLMGLLYDGEGNRFTPSHTNKNGRRYRYYVSQTIIKNGSRGRPRRLRLPAQETEDLVTAQLTSLLRSPQKLLELSGSASPDSSRTHEVVEFTRGWANAPQERLHTLLKTVVTSVVIEKERVIISLGRRALREAIWGSQDDPATEPEVSGAIAMEVQAHLNRFGGEVRFELPPDVQGAKPRPVPALVRALARAHDWVERILYEDGVNQQSIADECGLDKRYISRLLPLAFLAPDITEAILDGRQPPHLSLDTCLEDVPAEWAQQRISFMGPSRGSAQSSARTGL